MGYFSNSTEGMSYEDRWCGNCVHEGDEEEGGCPIWMLHHLFNYDQHGGGARSEDLNTVLTALIPREDGGENKRCSMFIRRDQEELDI